MQTYQDKISLNIRSTKNHTSSNFIANMDNISIIKPILQTSIIPEENITPFPQSTISPTMQVERGAPETKSQATANNTFQQPPTNKNSKGFMPPTPGNQLPGQSKNSAPRFASEVLNSLPPDVKSSSPEWRLNRA